MTLSGQRNVGETFDEIFDELRAALEEIGVDADLIGPEARLVDDLELDSLDWVDLAHRLEERYAVALQEEGVADLHTLRQVAQLIEARLSGSVGR